MAASLIDWIRNFRSGRNRFTEQPTRTVEVKRINHREAYPPNALNKTSTSPTFNCVVRSLSAGRNAQRVLCDQRGTVDAISRIIR